MKYRKGQCVKIIDNEEANSIHKGSYGTIICSDKDEDGMLCYWVHFTKWTENNNYIEPELLNGLPNWLIPPCRLTLKQTNWKKVLK